MKQIHDKASKHSVPIKRKNDIGIISVIAKKNYDMRNVRKTLYFIYDDLKESATSRIFRLDDNRIYSMSFTNEYDM